MRSLIASFQWMIFILMGSIVIPVAVGVQYQLEAGEIVAFVSRTLFVLGIASLLQSILGHRLPIAEGPSGIWWGVFIVYLGIGPLLFGDLYETLRVLEYAFILSGILFIILSLLGLVEKVAKLFTPTVMGTYLILMVVQLSSSFMAGIAGVTASHPTLNPTILLLSIITVGSAFVARLFAPLRAYSTLISVAVGWGLFVIFGYAGNIYPTEHLIELPQPFAFGTPRLEWNMIPSILLVTILLLTNLLASVRAVQSVKAEYGEAVAPRYRQTGFIAGIIQILSGVFAAVGPVALSGSAAFIAQTGVRRRLPLIIGSLLIVGISLSPMMTAFFAALPPAVGYAALLPTFGFGTLMIAMQQIRSASDFDVQSFVVSVALFLGIGVMFIPTESFASLPPLFTSILSNGVILGTALVIILEQLIRYRERRNESNSRALESASIEREK